MTDVPSIDVLTILYPQPAAASKPGDWFRKRTYDVVEPMKSAAGSNEPSGPARRGDAAARVCVEQARQRRRRAAKLLECAQRQDDLANGTARGEVRGFGNECYLRGYAARLREFAAEELRGLPP